MNNLHPPGSDFYIISLILWKTLRRREIEHSKLRKKIKRITYSNTETSSEDNPLEFTSICNVYNKKKKSREKT